jgi:hypothetical protein
MSLVDNNSKQIIHGCTCTDAIPGGLIVSEYYPVLGGSLSAGTKPKHWCWRGILAGHQWLGSYPTIDTVQSHVGKTRQSAQEGVFARNREPRTCTTPDYIRDYWRQMKVDAGRAVVFFNCTYARSLPTTSSNPADGG